MNSNDERLLRYFENEMSDQERKEFEIILNSNPDLLSKLNEFNQVSSSFSAYKDIKADERYFSNLIPRFNERKKQSRVSLFAEYLFRPVYLYSALSSMIAVIIIFVTLNSINKTSITENIQSAANELQETELTQELKTLQNEYYTNDKINDSVADSVVNNYYYDEIKENPGQVSEYITSTSGYTATEKSIYENISDEEADMIYNQLINKKIL